MLRERLPDGEIVALDGSASMVALARERLGEERVTYLVADLLEPLPVDPPVDAVLSTATFHWIPDHDRLFANLAAVMRPGAQLVAQCGGQGNIASVEAALHDMGESFEGRKTFAGPEDTRARLQRAGFTDIETWLQDEPTPLDPRGPRAVPGHDRARRPRGRHGRRRAPGVRRTRSRSACRPARSTTSG